MEGSSKIDSSIVSATIHEINGMKHFPESYIKGLTEAMKHKVKYESEDILRCSVLQGVNLYFETINNRIQ